MTIPNDDEPEAVPTHLQGTLDDPHLAQEHYETDVKQAFTGRHTLIVLIASGVLAILVVLGLWALRANDMERSGTDVKNEAAAASLTYNQAEPGAKQAPAYPTPGTVVPVPAPAPATPLPATTNNIASPQLR